MSRQALAEQVNIPLKSPGGLGARLSGIPARSPSRSAATWTCRSRPWTQTPGPLAPAAARAARTGPPVAGSQPAKSASGTPIIRALETATMRPSHEVCIGLLGVKALALWQNQTWRRSCVRRSQESRAAAPNPYSRWMIFTILQRFPEPPGLTDGAASRPPIEQRASTAPGAQWPAISSWRVSECECSRMEMCIEMRPPAPPIQRTTPIRYRRGAPHAASQDHSP